MPVMRNISIKHKLILVAMLTCLVALLSAAVGFIAWEWTALRYTMVQNLSTQAKIIADNCKAALAFQDTKDAEETLSALHVQPSIVLGCIYTKTGTVFASYYREGTDNKIAQPKLDEDGYSFGDGFLTVFRRVILGKETVGTVCLRSDMSPMYAMLKRNISIIVVVLLLSSLIAFLASSQLQKVISRPILGLAKSAIAIGKGELNHRVLVQSKDELGYLAESFNEMAEHLEQTTTSIDNLNREIAERKRAEERLQETESRLRQALLASDTGTWKWDIISNQDTRDAAFNKMLGLEQKDTTQPVEDFIGHIYPEDRQRVEAEIQRSMKEHDVYKVEFRIVRANGEIRWLSDRGETSYDNAGKPSFMTGAVVDITERKEAEQRQAELLKQVESANKELEDFAYVVSHDLKAPLRGIKTLANWLSTDYADKLDEDGREQMSLLSSRVDRMHNLIDGILQYSRVGRAKEEKVPVNLNELVPNIVDSLAPPENITITIDNELPTIECEHTRIIQVFQNLLSNAIKYMDKPQGQIQIGCAEENGFWKFSVTDNGPGIEEKHFEKIFQMFQTLSSRDDFESTGVGLTVVKKIVESHGGRIWLESKVGEGSTFFFTLPKQEMGVIDANL